MQVGLRGINGLYLFEIERADGSKVRVADHDTVLQTGDLLWFAGEALGLRRCQGLLRYCDGAQHLAPRSQVRVRTIPFIFRHVHVFLFVTLSHVYQPTNLLTITGCIAVACQVTWMV